MNARNVRLSLAVAVAALLAVGGPARARHVLHRVTPQNIGEQPYAFAVKVKDVGKFKEVEIRVERARGKLAPGPTAGGEVTVAGSGKPVASPPLTMVRDGGTVTFTFRVPAVEFDRVYFTFTETPQDVRNPFPFPGDYFGFDLRAFVGGTRAQPPQRPAPGRWPGQGVSPVF
jgi:hypothetical protein